MKKKKEKEKKRTRSKGGGVTFLPVTGGREALSPAAQGRLFEAASGETPSNNEEPRTVPSSLEQLRNSRSEPRALVRSLQREAHELS